MTTAFVLSGGGSLGAVQVGMLQALAARGIAPDLLVGTSAGAFNAAYVAGYGMSETALAKLEAIWSGLRRRDVFPIRATHVAAAGIGATPSICANGGLRRLLERHLSFVGLDNAPVPIHVVAVDVRSGEEVLLSRGDAVDAVLASAAIPAVFPPVRVAGRDLVDGGIANNAAVSQAVALGADRVYVLPSGFACALDEPPRTVLASAVHALTLLVQQRLVHDVARLATEVDLRVLPPLCPLTVPPADFGHGGWLVERARTATARWLDTGGDRLPHPEVFLSLHHHETREVAA